MNLDKSNWKKVRFGDVVFEKKITVEAKSCGLERYIAGEHMVSEDLHLRSWGTIGDDYLGPAFHRKFEKGDILYGSRRTYLKKVAIADFDGVTANTTFVLRENTDLVVPGFIPFLMLSDTFTEHSVRNSKGSVNPYINYKDIAQFQFLLPPKDQQARLAELLWAGDAVVEGYGRLCTALKSAKSSHFETVYCDPEVGTMPLGNCLEFSQYGISESLSENGEIPVLRMNNIVEGKITLDDLKYVDSKSIAKLETVMLQKGDILFNRTNSFDLVGKVGIFDSDMRATFASYLIRLKANDNIILPKFLNLYLNSAIGQRLIKIHRTPGVSQSNINPENLKKIDVPTLPISKQKIFLEKVDAVEKAEVGYLTLQKGTKATLSLLLHQIFTP